MTEIGPVGRFSENCFLLGIVQKGGGGYNLNEEVLFLDLNSCPKRGGDGSRPLLNNVQKEAAFFFRMTSLTSRPNTRSVSPFGAC